MQTMAVSPMSDRKVRLTRTDPYHPERGPFRDRWHVVLDGKYVGRVRKTDGGWNGSYWYRRSSTSREMVSLGGSWHRRDEAVAGVVGAWLEDER